MKSYVSRFLWLVLALGAAVSAQPVSTPNSRPTRAHALVIGSGAYVNAPKLANPVNDAKAIGAKLTKLGFAVTTVQDASRAGLLNAMEAFKRSAAGSDLTLLFYSGHGLQVQGEVYLVPVDATTDKSGIQATGVPLRVVMDQFMPGKRRLVLYDSDLDDPFASAGSAKSAPVNESTEALIAYASRVGAAALDGEGSNSPFTQALLDHIGEPIDIGLVLRKVREQVFKATHGLQGTWEQSSLTGGALVLSPAKRAR